MLMSTRWTSTAPTMRRWTRSRREDTKTVQAHMRLYLQMNASCNTEPIRSSTLAFCNPPKSSIPLIPQRDCRIPNDHASGTSPSETNPRAPKTATVRKQASALE